MPRCSNRNCNRLLQMQSCVSKHSLCLAYEALRLNMDMKTRVKWIEGVAFAGESGSGHAVVLDGAADGGGRNVGMRPMEMLLTGAAACTAYDVVTILRRGRHPVADVAVVVEAQRAPEPPRVFTRLHFAYTVAGRGLDRKHVERAILLSKEKYCSATIMLGKTAEVTWDLALVDGDRVPAPAAAAA